MATCGYFCTATDTAHPARRPALARPSGPTRRWLAEVCGLWVALLARERTRATASFC